MFAVLEIGQLVTERDPPGRELLRTRLQQRLESSLGEGSFCRHGLAVPAGDPNLNWYSWPR
jgi:hypothetical protein